MLGEVLASLITSAGAVTVGWLGLWGTLAKLRSDMSAVKESTVNSHATILRDDVDDVNTKVTSIADRLESVHGAVLEVRDAHARTSARVSDVDQRVAQLDERLTTSKAEADEHHADIWRRLGTIAGRVDDMHTAVTGEIPVQKPKDSQS